MGRARVLYDNHGRVITRYGVNDCMGFDAAGEGKCAGPVNCYRQAGVSFGMPFTTHVYCCEAHAALLGLTVEDNQATA